MASILSLVQSIRNQKGYSKLTGAVRLEFAAERTNDCTQARDYAVRENLLFCLEI